MSQGSDFANYASSDEAPSTASEDVWFVAVSSDDIKQMSVDQLDEAFRLGVITAQTAVWTEGMQAWAPLGEVADLDAGDEAAGAAEQPEASAVSHLGQHAVSHLGHGQGSHLGQGSVPGFGHAPAPAASNLSNALFGGPDESAAAVSPNPGPSSFAPVTSSHMPSPLASTGPVALNVDEDGPPVRRGRGAHPVRWLLAAAGVVGAGVIAYNVASSGHGATVAVAEKPASAAPASASPAAAASGSHAYEVPPEHGTTQPAAVKEEAPVAKADPAGKDAPIGSVPSSSPDDEKGGDAADAPPAKSGRESARGSIAKAFGKKGAASSKAASAKSGRASKHGKAGSRATAARATSTRAASSKSSSKKSSVPRTQSAFDPLNGSLP